MKSVLEPLINDYYDWLKNQTKLKMIDKKWSKISTPFYDRHNDNIVFYVCATEQGYRLTDDSYILDDLAMNGCPVNSESRIKLLNVTLSGYGVTRENDELTIITSKDDFHYKMHNFVQAMLAVNDLFYVSRTNVFSSFVDDVASWLDDHDIRYSPNVPFVGKSGLQHNYNFLIPKSKVAPERIIKTVNTLSQEKVQTLLFGWVDTIESRPENTQLYIIINDRDKKIKPDFVLSLKNYNTHPVSYSGIEGCLDKLIA